MRAELIRPVDFGDPFEQATVLVPLARTVDTTTAGAVEDLLVMHRRPVNADEIAVGIVARLLPIRARPQ